MLHWIRTQLSILKFWPNPFRMPAQSPIVCTPQRPVCVKSFSDMQVTAVYVCHGDSLDNWSELTLEADVSSAMNINTRQGVLVTMHGLHEVDLLRMLWWSPKITLEEPTEVVVTSYAWVHPRSQGYWLLAYSEGNYQPKSPNIFD